MYGSKPVASSAMCPHNGEYNTMQFFMVEIASLGLGYEFVFNDSIYEFKDNIIRNFDKFDFRNMCMCQFLNLCGSSISEFNAISMFSLVYVDIRAS